MRSTLQTEFSKVYDQYAPILWRHILLRTSSPEESDEILSKAFLRTWEYLRARKKVRNIRGFLWTVTDRLIVDFYRSASTARVRFADYSAFEATEPAVSPELDEHLTAKQGVADVMTAMEKLRPDERLIISLRFIEDMDLGEVAATVGKSKNATSVAIHRALKRLNHILG